MIAEAVKAWFEQGTSHDFQKLTEQYDPEYLIKELMFHFPSMNHQASIASRLKGLDLFPRPIKPVRTVGLFYYRLYNGGSEMVISRLSFYLSRAGYRIVLFTDLPPDKNDFPLPEGTQRYILPDTFQLTTHTRETRFDQLKEKLIESKTDVLIHNAWLSHNLLWDLLATKAAGVSFIAYIHGAFTCPFIEGHPNEMDQLFQITRILGLADHIVSLSHSFSHFWSQFNPSSTALLDPCPQPEPPNPAIIRDPDLLLWVGRIAPEKQTHEAIRILGEARKSLPKVHLIIVGKADDAYLSYEEEVHTLVDQLGLKDAVSFEGYRTNVGDYYQKAALLLMTSAHEGFGLVIAEAKTYGLPCVAYDMPYSHFSEDGRAFFTAPQRDARAAAELVCKLLKDPGAMQIARQLALESAEAYSEPQLTAQWQTVFQKLESPETASYDNNPSRIWGNALLEDLHLGLTRVQLREEIHRKQEESGLMGCIFSASYYMNRYPDLKAAFGTDDVRLLRHFWEFGMTEGRQGCDSFDVHIYRERYADLQQALGNDLKAYYLHYLLHGFREGRSGK